MVSCACSAGPAFEGGDISCGMRATDGAIESCVIDPETMEPTFGIIGEPGQKPVGLCGSGIIDTIAELFHAGILNSKGIFVREGKRVAHDRHGCGRYILATPEESATGREVALNEVDIDNFIRAKGAIYSAIDTLLAAMDMDESVIESFYVAGGIGSGINMRNAVRIGMFPNVPLELFHYIGNSSLAGAYTMALSDEANDRVEPGRPQHDLYGAVHAPGLYGRLRRGLLPSAHRRRALRLGGIRSRYADRKHKEEVPFAPLLRALRRARPAGGCRAHRHAV